MLGMEASYPIFSGGVHEYFKTQVGLDAARLQRLFFGNAIRFLGLRQGDKARARLEHFYDRHGLDKRRLPTIAA